jgi:hypothetical protein
MNLESDSMPLTTAEYLLKIKINVDALKTRLNLPSFFAANSARSKVRNYFLDRAFQNGEACFRIADLQTPLTNLMRSLCEDFFTLYWVSLSDENADAYCKSAISEMAKTVRVNITNKRARIRDTVSGTDVTSECLPALDDCIAKKKTIEQIATESGLNKVYDVIYRHGSLDVHGNTFGLSEIGSELDGIVAVCSAINAFLRIFVLVADNPTATVEEILSTLNMRGSSGHAASTSRQR